MLKMMKEVRCKDGEELGKKVSLGIVQTAYTNSACKAFQGNFGVQIETVAQGVKYLLRSA